MTFEILLSTGSGQPIYEQIEQQIEAMISSGTLQPGQSIPSIRELARMLRVSVITVQKAYDNLKESGLIESAVGKGTTVRALSSEQIEQRALRKAEASLKKAVQIAKEAGLSREVLQKALSDLFDQEEIQ